MVSGAGQIPPITDPPGMLGATRCRVGVGCWWWINPWAGSWQR